MESSHFVIVGGGTAGWLAALIIQDAARGKHLHLKISVIESSKIPTIGVGEGTTAVFRAMLQRFGFDELEFLRDTEATIKLGIRHRDWRRVGVTYDGPIDDPHQALSPPADAPSEYLNVYSVAAGRPVSEMHLFKHLMERRKSPYGRRKDGSLIPVGPFHYAYHFDQALVGRYLKKKSSDIAEIDGTVAGVEKNPTTGNINALTLEEGGTIAGDFFIDATGFRKRLICLEMGGTWRSYRAELPVNRALPFWLDIEEGEEIAPYTHAWAREAGWLWSIPTQKRYGCGYVYSDEFKTPDEARAEIEAALGRPIEPRNDIRFDVGRLDRAWIGNCLAVGLSSSFLEPLEATSIHGTVVQMLMFAGGFLRDAAQATDKQRDDYNSRVAHQVDDFRTFINMHYVSQRDDTPFWRFVRNESIHTDTEARLERWRHEMPRHEHFPQFLGGLPHVEAQLHYPVLDGLCLLDRRVAKAELAKLPSMRAFARKSVDSLVREYKQASSKALGHAEYLALARAAG
jgi:hypothetical protein